MTHNDRRVLRFLCALGGTMLVLGLVRLVAALPPPCEPTGYALIPMPIGNTMYLMPMLTGCR